MIGHPTTFADGGTLIDFSNYDIPHPFVMSQYQSRVSPLVKLPGGATFDTYEGSDLPAPQLMPIDVDVLMTAANWNTTVETWRGYQGRYGTLTARPVNIVGTQSCSAYLQTVNLVEQWGNGARVRLTFEPVEDWS